MTTRLAAHLHRQIVECLEDTLIAIDIALGFHPEGSPERAILTRLQRELKAHGK